MWKNFVREYLSFSKSQRRGLYGLLVIVLLCMIAPLFFPYFSNRPDEDEQAFRKEVAAFLKAQQKPVAAVKKEAPPVVLFPFDPNKISVKDWQRLGVSVKTAIVIQHYRDAGGVFYKKEDLKKIYGFSEEAFQKLSPYIRIEKQEKTTPYKHIRKQTFAKTSSFPERKTYKKKSFSIDINKADSAAWTMLYGIGPTLSARIIRYRKSLGGFYKTEQIAEVYNIPDSIYQQIKSRLTISPFPLKKLNINTASIEELSRHPYIDYKLAKSINAYRQMHGKFGSLQQLKELQLVNDQIYRKIAPYLTVK